MFTRKWISFAWILVLGSFAWGCSDQKPRPATTSTAPTAQSPINASPARLAPVAETTVAETSNEKPHEDPVSPQEVTLQSTQSAPAEAKDANPAEPSVEPAKTVQQPTAKPTETSKSDRSIRTFPESQFLPANAVGVIVVHPKQFFETPFGKLLTELDVDSFTFRGMVPFSPQLQKRLRDIERITVVIDQQLVNTLADEAGMEVVEQEMLAPPFPAVAVENDILVAEVMPDDIPPNAAADQLQKIAMKRVGLAFHMYHDVYAAFPRADGDAQGESTGLSWRVHLLPYLDQTELYEQFHLDEPWDSEHNKSLIDKMPDVFKTPGVDDKTKTSIHVFTGQNTPFDGEKGRGINGFLDGTSNTLLAVVAGNDQAEIWTRPGGLEVDLTDPKKSLGELSEERFLALLADGSVHVLPVSLADTDLANLIQPADGNVVGIDLQQPMDVIAPPIPMVIFQFATAPDQEAISKELLTQFEAEDVGGKRILKNAVQAVWFADDRTGIVGSIDTIKRAIESKPNEKFAKQDLLDELQLDADFTAAFDLGSQLELIRQLTAGNPLLGMVTNIATLSASVSASGKADRSLLELHVTAVDANMAAGLAAFANMGLNQARQSIAQVPELPNANAGEKQIQAMFQQLVASATVKIDAERIDFVVPTPDGFDQLPEILKPALMNAKAAAVEAQPINVLKQLGLAFHNFHDTFGAFPGAGRMSADKPVGLSWRVYLLPYLDQAPLYNQFNFDEPWDSEHNKALIEKMPDIFKSPGVDEPGKTAFHIFTGPQSPFADDQVPLMQQFTDGTSNTILAVLAGADTAEVWTKPGGFDFDPDDPIKALGKLESDHFKALMADGSVRRIKKDIEAPTLRRLIQWNDGEALP